MTGQAAAAPGLATPPFNPSETRDTRVRLELLDIGSRNGAMSGWLTLVVVAFTFALLDAGSIARLLGWLIAMAIGAGVRIGAQWRWKRSQAAMHPRERSRGGALRIDDGFLRRWEHAHAAIALMSGLLWSVLVFTVPPDDERTLFLVSVALAVGLVLANGSHVASRYAHLLFAIPIVVMQEINLLRLSGDDRDVFALGWPVLVVGLYLLHRVASDALLTNLSARIEHERRSVELKALVDTAPLGILVVREGRIVVCNDAVLRIFGYEHREDLLGRSIRMLIPDDAAWRETLKDAEDAIRGPVRSRIVRRRRRDGSVMDVKLDIAAVEPDNRETEFIGIYENINERLAIEEGFRHAVQMQRLVFESAGEGIAIVNDGTIEQVNQAFADLVGVPAAQLRRRAFQTIFEDPLGWVDIERQFQRLRSTLKIERRIVRSDGRALWASVTGRHVESPPPAGQGSDGLNARSIWILGDLTALKEKEAENWHHANHDVLTGLPNRRFLQDRLDQALALARRDGRRVAVLSLDLDGFKQVNDSHGHRFGDAVLEEVARRLTSVVREFDTVGRWGGDEFMLVLKEIDSREAVEDMVERVIGSVSESIDYRGTRLVVGVSIGIGLFPDHGEEVEAVILAADLAMYESKGAGGNTWRFSPVTSQGPRGKYRPSIASSVTPPGE